LFCRGGWGGWGGKACAGVQEVSRCAWLQQWGQVLEVTI
jgi:hypothetical protein